LLADHGIEFERRDYFKEPFSVDELRPLFDEIGMTPTELLSKRSKAYKDLGLAERDVTDDELIQLIPDNPTLIRRPIVVKNGEAVVGFSQAKIEELIQK
jgi:arsenate reductase (glutaredoxin)